MTKDGWNKFLLVALKLIVALLAGMIGFVIGMSLAMYIVYREYPAIIVFFVLLVVNIFIIYGLGKIRY